MSNDNSESSRKINAGFGDKRPRRSGGIVISFPHQKTTVAFA